MTRRLVLTLIPLAWWLSTSLAPAQETFAPPTFQPGFEYTLRSHQTLETVLGAGLPNAGKQVADVTLEVTAACRASSELAQHREVSIQLDKVLMNVLMGGLKLTYDSTQPDSGETVLGQSFRNLIGTSFQVVLDPADRITQVKGQEKFAASASPLGQQVGIEQLTQIAMPMLALEIPGEGVVPGQTWKHVTDSSMGPAGKLKASYQVTYQGDEAGAAVFQYEAQLQAGGEHPSQVRVSIEDGTLKGDVRVDKTRRFPTGGSGQGSLTMHVPNPADPAQILKLPIVQRRSFELLRMKPLE